jgi:3-hydroxyisobutyrate dehydrogenase-like beta-hydroxyacid dehydrogenase
VAEVLRQGSGSSTMLAIRAPLMASRNFTPAPGPFSSMRKYLELGAELAYGLDCSTPLFSAASAYFFRGLEAGMDDEDISAVIKLIEAESGTHPTDNTTPK